MIVKEDDRGSADFRYMCSYFREAPQGVVIVDVNAAHGAHWLERESEETVFQALNCIPRKFWTVDQKPDDSASSREEAVGAVDCYG